MQFEKDKIKDLFWITSLSLKAIWSHFSIWPLGASIPGGVGGPDPPKDMYWGGPKSKGPPIKMNMFAIYHGYYQNKISVLTGFFCSKS